MFGWCSEQLRHWSKRGLSPPREEDRKLPLHKLFENLQEFEQTVPASVRSTVYNKSMSGCTHITVTIFRGLPVSFLAVFGASFANLCSPFVGRY